MIDPLEYMDYVKSLVRARFSGKELDDLVSVGYYALIKASKMYKPDRGACFKTYLTIKVMGEVRNYLRTQPTLHHRSKKHRVTLTQFSVMSNTEEGTYDNSIVSDRTFYDIDFLKKKSIRSNKSIQAALKYYVHNKSYQDLQTEYNLSDRTICRMITEGRNQLTKEVQDLNLV